MLGRYCFRKLKQSRIQEPLTKEFHPDAREILVCQGNTCSSSDSAKVLAAFQVDSPSDVKISGCGCLGQCGNGPMVLVLPEKTWYSEVSCNAVRRITKQHLLGSKPVESLLYSKFHPLPASEREKTSNFIFGGLIVLSVMIAITITWVLNLKQY